MSYSFIRDAIHSSTSSGRDNPLPLSPVLRFPTGPQNQCVIINLLTVTIRTIRKKYSLSGRREIVEVKDPTNRDLQSKDIPFGRASRGGSLPKASGQASSSFKARGHVEEAEETVVQSYPTLGDQVWTCLIIHNDQLKTCFTGQDIYNPSKTINDYILQTVLLLCAVRRSPVH